MTLDSIANEHSTISVERLRELAPLNGVEDRLRFLETLVKDDRVLVIQGGLSQIHTILSGPHEDRASQIYYITKFGEGIEYPRAEFMHPLNPNQTFDVVQDKF